MEPASAPPAQPGPAELVSRLGTDTPKLPPEPAVRNGGSSVTGLVGSVVYGPPQDAAAGKHWAGAPLTPEKTWFQTPLVQPSRSLLRTSHCCCDPLITLAFISESAMKPPLASLEGGEQ